MALLSRKFLASLLAAGLLAVAPAALFAAQPPAGSSAGAPAASKEVPANADLSKIEGDPLVADADVARGKEVFAKVGVCVSCHGWDGDGTGKNPRSDGIAALLRESGLDSAGFIEIISCGVPGTGMPYHDNQAYTDDRCYGMKKDDFEAGQMPHKGKSIRPDDVKNLVAYIMTTIQGRPKATYEDCEAYFDATAAKNCATMKK